MKTNYLQSQPKVSGHPQTKALPRFPSFNVDGSPSKDVACEAIDCLNSESLTLYFSGLEGDVLSFNSFQNILSRHG